jgi:hypothetical protein
METPKKYSHVCGPANCMVSNDQFRGSSGCKEPGSMWNTQWLDTLRHGDYANMTHVPPSRIKRKAGRHKMVMLKLIAARRDTRMSKMAKRLYSNPHQTHRDDLE